MSYVSTKLRSPIVVNHIITIHYFEYMKDFCFKGESHDFWEILCVDKGVVEIQADDRYYHLKQGDLIIHKPLEFHAIQSLDGSAPNLIAISFTCHSPALRHLYDKCFSLDPHHKYLVSKIITEARSAFSTPLHIPTIEKVERSDSACFGSEQLIKLYLEELLIHLIRDTQNTLPLISPTAPKASKHYTFENIVRYLNEHIYESLCVETICSHHHMSKSSLQNLFYTHAQCGVKTYFNHMKIELAKQLIRQDSKNISQISELLGYTSLSHFSKHFKKTTGMPPSAYERSIKYLSENIR